MSLTEKLTPLGFPPLSNEDREYSDFEKRRALQQYHEICTNEMAELIADDLFIRKVSYSPALRCLTDLMAVFDNSACMGDDYIDLNHLSGYALRGRDAEMLNDIAKEMYEPYSQLDNSSFVEKIRKVANGEAKPGLRIIR